MEKPIVSIRTTDDLKKILFLQKTISSRAKNELLDIVNDQMINPDDSNIEDHVEEFMEAEGRLLEKYANYPTLTEFQLMPHLSDGTKWGATFGVTLLVGELFLEQLRIAHPHFTPIIRQLFIVLLSELDDPQHEYLIEPLEGILKSKAVIIEEEGKEVSKVQQKAVISKLINDFVDTTVALCEAFGVIEIRSQGVAITNLGKRVLLHLMDATKFIDEMTVAHTKFQVAKPKLSML